MLPATEEALQQAYVNGYFDGAKALGTTIMLNLAAQEEKTGDDSKSEGLMALGAVLVLRKLWKEMGTLMERVREQPPKYVHPFWFSQQTTPTSTTKQDKE